MTARCAADGRVRRQFDEEIVATFRRLGPCGRAIQRDLAGRGMKTSVALILRRLRERRLWPDPLPVGAQAQTPQPPSTGEKE